MNNFKGNITSNEVVEWLKKVQNIPAKQPSEDLGIDEELKRFLEINNLFVDANDLQTVRHCNGSPVDKRYYFEDTARHFAQWQKEQTINKACTWILNNFRYSGYGCPLYYNGINYAPRYIVKDFKKAMEDK